MKITTLPPSDEYPLGAVYIEDVDLSGLCKIENGEKSISAILSHWAIATANAHTGESQVYNRTVHYVFGHRLSTKKAIVEFWVENVH